MKSFIFLTTTLLTAIPVMACQETIPQGLDLVKTEHSSKVYRKDRLIISIRCEHGSAPELKEAVQRLSMTGIQSTPEPTYYHYDANGEGILSRSFMILKGEDILMINFMANSGDQSDLDFTKGIASDISGIKL